MRSEQDAIGEVLLSEKEYFGIGTARLCTLIKPFGPCIPERLIVNVVRVRQAQAQMLGLNADFGSYIEESSNSARVPSQSRYARTTTNMSVGGEVGVW